MRLQIVLGALLALYALLTFWPSSKDERIGWVARLHRGARRLRTALVWMLGVGGLVVFATAIHGFYQSTDGLVLPALLLLAGCSLMFSAWRLWR